LAASGKPRDFGGLIVFSLLKRAGASEQGEEARVISLLA
jgi:hypothetical protein